MTPVTKRKEMFVKRLKKEKNGEYELIGEYIKQKERTLFKHKNCGHEWETTPHTLINAKGTLGCPKCQYREKSYTTEEFDSRIQKESKGKFSLADGEVYVNSTTKLNVYCRTCDSFFRTTPVNLTLYYGCPSCRNKVWRGKTTKQFEEEMYARYKGEYVLSDGAEYRGANEKIRIVHTSCGHEWLVRASHILHRSGCPNCNESKGERLVAYYLNKHKVKFYREYTIEDCRNYKELPFDFALFTDDERLIGLVEYDGIQHYKPFEHFGGLKKFNRQKENDSVKDKYCLDNGINLLRIPYYLEDKEVEKEIIRFIVEK